MTEASSDEMIVGVPDWVSRLLREPLVHFLILALLIFGAYRHVGAPAEAEPDRIEVTSAKIEQLAGLFAKSWQRAPNAEELKGLIDDFIKEEIMYREALKMGLDKDDTVIRRRLRQKMEFLADASAGLTEPTERELTEFLERNAERFLRPSQIAFEQIYFNRETRGPKLEADVESALQRLREDPAVDAAALADPSLLPPVLQVTPKTEIAKTFGADFANALADLAVGEWSGPVPSSYGLHIVRLTSREEARAPTLGEVHDAVLREWTNDRRAALEKERYDELLRRYKVQIDSTAQGRSTP